MKLCFYKMTEIQYNMIVGSIQNMSDIQDEMTRKILAEVNAHDG